MDTLLLHGWIKRSRGLGFLASTANPSLPQPDIAPSHSNSTASSEVRTVGGDWAAVNWRNGSQADADTPRCLHTTASVLVLGILMPQLRCFTILLHSRRRSELFQSLLGDARANNVVHNGPLSYAGKQTNN